MAGFRRVRPDILPGRCAWGCRVMAGVPPAPSTGVREPTIAGVSFQHHRVEDVMAARDFRIEHDSMGELEVPADALWGASTQRAVENFPVSGRPMPRGFIRALGLLKAAAAEANAGFGLLPKGLAASITKASNEVAAGEHDAHFPVDVYQTGSGTSSNMNANEVIATLATRAGKRAVHPNDHVNLGQSSNDVVPTALRVSAQLAVVEDLLPALQHLRKRIDRKGRSLRKVVKT